MERSLKAPEPLLVVLLGPTASGKTALSLQIARHFSGEIVNCDSVALYRDFEIGTAKPALAERSQTVHHLLDCIPPMQPMTAGEYGRLARSALDEIRGRERLPIVVGGTGLYLRALLEGLFPGPQRSEDLRERLRARSAERGSSYLHRILRRLDPAAAHTIHPNDIPKLIRAVEVCLCSERSMTDLWAKGRDPLVGFRILRIGLSPDRRELYDRINQRARQMFDTGLIEETQTLLQKHGDKVPAMGSLGYKQAVQFLRGEIDRPTALLAAQQAHRNYAKRQVTWFRREPDVIWISGFGDDIGVQDTVIQRIRPLL